MGSFGFSGLWKHSGSTIIAAGVVLADTLLSYLGTVTLPTWAHAVVGVASFLLATYKGKQAAPPVQG